MCFCVSYSVVWFTVSMITVSGRGGQSQGHDAFQTCLSNFEGRVVSMTNWMTVFLSFLFFFFFKWGKLSRPEHHRVWPYHLTPQRRKCVDSVVLTKISELHCCSQEEKHTAHTLLGLGKLHPSGRRGGYFLFVSVWFCLFMSCLQSEVFLTLFSHTVYLVVYGVHYSSHCFNPSKVFIWNQIIRFKTKLYTEDSLTLISLWIIFDHKICFF